MKSQVKTISGKIVDVIKREIFGGIISIKDGKIFQIEKTDKPENQYIMPGFVDSHIHIESSMLTPYEFSRVSMQSGVISVVTDPHEIANVLGKEGINFMVNSASKTPMKIYFGAPSCVPASPFETSGSVISPQDVDELLQRKKFVCLSEMMNFPGVINQQPNEMDKIRLSHKYQKPIDGHIPGINGEDLKKYIDAGISTDHECTTLEEAKEKISLGMKILIREGSAAKDFENLSTLIASNPDDIMFCSDDLHPNNLIQGHINLLVMRAIQKGYNIFDVLKAAHLNPKLHYNLEIGSLQKGDDADFLVVDDLDNFHINSVFIAGKEVVKNRKSLLPMIQEPSINNFSQQALKMEEIRYSSKKHSSIPIIRAFDGSLFTKKEMYLLKNDNFQGSSDDDVLKIVVVNRYNKSAKPAIGFIKGFGLRNCAIASSVAHDSHNIVAVGTDDKKILEVINSLIELKGGLGFVSDHEIATIPLKIAGIISNENYEKIASEYDRIENLAKKYNSHLTSPFMTLAFMCLTVIPEIKLSDLGLFDSVNFRFFV